MPLRDHFRSPVDDVHSWDELHGMWPAVIVQKLMKVLPEPYYAAPGIHLGTLYEVDIGTYREPALEMESEGLNSGEGCLAIATYAPPKPTLISQPQLPTQDVYEVRIYDSRRNRRLVAAIEIVSPSNKDRPERRTAFVSKVATLLKENICVSIVDVVSTMNFNLYAELMQTLQCVDPALETESPSTYAATMRTRYEEPRRMLDTWYYPLGLREPLPTLPIWLTESRAVSLDLESSYEETCQTLRIR